MTQNMPKKKFIYLFLFNLFNLFYNFIKILYISYCNMKFKNKYKKAVQLMVTNKILQNKRKKDVNYCSCQTYGPNSNTTNKI